MTPTECTDAVVHALGAASFAAELARRFCLQLERVDAGAANGVRVPLPRAAAPPSPAPEAPPMLITCTTLQDRLGQPLSVAAGGAPHGGRAFFQHPPANITLVADRLHSAADVRAALGHELQHAVDLLVHGMDLASCGGLACSEVRAAGAAECGALPAGSRRRRACVLERATASTAMVFPAVGAACVAQTLALCLDSAPSRNPTAAPGYAALLDAEARALAPPGRPPPDGRGALLADTTRAAAASGTR